MDLGAESEVPLLAREKRLVALLARYERAVAQAVEREDGEDIRVAEGQATGTSGVFWV